ncbi:MAG: CRTAC1 family protein [Acidobacteriota bacterium]
MNWRLLVVALAAWAPVFPVYENVAPQAGLAFKLTSGTPSKAYILESMGGGVGFIDYDGDGWVDVFLVNGSTLEAERDGNNRATSRLFRNKGDGTFEDVTHKAGVHTTRWGMGVCVGDVNNDGFEDLYLTNFGPNMLLLNKGDGTFQDFSEDSHAQGSEWSSSCAFADYDQDGDLDLYVSNYLEFDVHRLPQDSPLCRFRGFRVQCGPRGLTPAQGRLYSNDGTGRFTDVTERAGLSKVRPYYSLGVEWADYDNDGDADLFVANDSTPNYLFRNNGDKTFSEVALLAGVAVSDDGREQAGMGVDFGDYDNDGDLDLIVTNFSEDYHTLYRNDGQGRFSDVSFAAGIAEPSWQYLGWGVQFVDLDLDGSLDVVAASGHVYPEVDVHQIGSYRQHNQVYKNLGNGRFQEMSSQSGPGFQELRASRGLAVGDINNDGRMDLLIANLDEAPSLLQSKAATGNWLLLKLKGTRSNHSAIGARVTIKTGSLSQMREVKSGGSYQSQNDLRLHFGLGSASEVDEIVVRWPSGGLQTLRKVPANRILTLEEKEE